MSAPEVVFVRHPDEGLFLDVVEGRLIRPDPTERLPDGRVSAQGPLDRAALDAAERVIGESWAWDRRLATVPISPLVAVTVARSLLPVAVTKSKVMRTRGHRPSD